MKVTCTIATLLSLATLAGAQMTATLAPVSTVALKREPTLVYDVTGSTIAGPVHTSFVVYNDGHASLSQFFNYAGGDGSVETRQISMLAVSQLVLDLDAAGADTLPDHIAFATDTPYQTVTFMKPGTDTKAHTFTILFGTPAHGNVIAIVNSFINTHFRGVTSLSAQAVSGGGPSIAAAAFVQEPVLIFDVTGSSIAGPVHDSVVVYNNGLVSVSEFRMFQGNDGSTRTVSVPVKAVRRLSSALAAAGAFSLQDSAATFPDLPVTTISVLSGKTDAKAHTFSVTVGNAGHAAVQGIIQNFLSTYVDPPTSIKLE